MKYILLLLVLAGCVKEEYSLEEDSYEEEKREEVIVPNNLPFILPPLTEEEKTLIEQAVRDGDNILSNEVLTARYNVGPELYWVEDRQDVHSDGYKAVYYEPRSKKYYYVYAVDFYAIDTNIAPTNGLSYYTNSKDPSAVKAFQFTENPLFAEKKVFDIICIEDPPIITYLGSIDFTHRLYSSSRYISIKKLEPIDDTYYADGDIYNKIRYNADIPYKYVGAPVIPYLIDHPSNIFITRPLYSNQFMPRLGRSLLPIENPSNQKLEGGTLYY